MGKKKTSSALAKRVRILEHKQDADDKTVETKNAYYTAAGLMDDAWSVNFGMLPRLLQGIEADGPTNVASNFNAKGRIGNTVNLRQLTANIICRLPVDTDGFGLGQTYADCRVIIVDNLTDNTGLTAADVLKDITQSYRSLLTTYKTEIGSGKRYRVMMDKKFNLNPAHPSHRLSFVMPISKSGRVVHYGSALDENPTDLNLSMIWFADAPVSLTSPKIAYFLKAKYEDA